MTCRKEEPGRDRPLSFLHQAPGYVVDRCDMIRIEAVAQAEAVGEGRCAEQDRLAGKRRKRPQPSRAICDDQNDAEASHAQTHAVGTVAQQPGK